MTSLSNTFGVAARNFVAYPDMPDAAGLVDYGVKVEELGYDSVWVWDHMLLGVDPNFPIIDSLTVLTGIASINVKLAAPWNDCTPAASASTPCRRSQASSARASRMRSSRRNVAAEHRPHSRPRSQPVR